MGQPTRAPSSQHHRTITTLYAFDGADGQGPNGLVQGADGDFYGVTFGGGDFDRGTVFNTTPTGALTTIYNFGSQDTDGSDPNGPLVQGADGYFYGTTFGWKPGGGRFSALREEP